MRTSRASISGKLDKAALDKWNEIFKETGLEKMSIPREMLAVVKVYFMLAFEEGQAYMINNMREIYNHDPCLFEDFFEENQKFIH